jgi:two-component system chemotaxis response regulator CheY
MSTPVYNIKVLVVDPQLSSANELKAALQLCGVKDIVFAKSGVEASVLVTECHFDLIISEWEMDPLNGLELLQFIKMSPTFKEIPFMMLTTQNEKAKVQDAVKSGVDDYVVKPITVEVIQSRIGKIIGKGLSHFISQLQNFANSAELSLENSQVRDHDKELEILLMFENRMKLIRASAKQYSLSHISYIAALSQELTKRTIEAKPKKVKKIISCLWDAISTIKILFENPKGQDPEEYKIVVNRLEKNLQRLKVNKLSLTDAEIESIMFEKLVKTLVNE